MQSGLLKIESVLLATDLDHRMDSALCYAISIARHYGATLRALHIASSMGIVMAGPDAMQLAADSAMREMVAAARHLEFTGRIGSLHFCPEVAKGGEGGIDDEICRSLRTTKADLVVVGTHRRQNVERLLYGSIAQGIARRTMVPVLTVGSRCPEMWNDADWDRKRPILYAATMHESPPRSWAYALSLARELGRELILLHVAARTAGGFRKSNAAANKTSEVDTVGWLDEMRGKQEELRQQITIRVDSGPVAEAILKVASQAHAGLIVMGMRPVRLPEWSARTSLAITQHVQQEAHCPVLTVRG